MTKIKEQARFDTRLSKAQKLLFEKAAQLGGYRSLTDFVVHTVQERAKEIVEKNEQVIASHRDNVLFFEAITYPEKPNNVLRSAAEAYQKFLNESVN